MPLYLSIRVRSPRRRRACSRPSACVMEMRVAGVWGFAQRAINRAGDTGTVAVCTAKAQDGHIVDVRERPVAVTLTGSHYTVP